MNARTTLLLMLALPLLVIGCGGDDENASAPAATSPAAETHADGGMQHIHGLGVASDGTLHIATHDGIWVARTGSTEVARHGDSRQDTMGFSLVDDRHFVGSGHPAPDDSGRPANLGLIESRDGGLTWESVSLSGEVDFHALEVSGRRVYGVDSGSGELFASADGGTTWRRHRLPAPTIALAVDPRDDRGLVISTEAGLFASADGGASWAQLPGRHLGLLAWDEPGALHLVDGSGALHVSRDRGRSWSASGDAGGQPAAILADGDTLYMALTDNLVQRSDDGGRTWRVRATPN